MNQITQLGPRGRLKHFCRRLFDLGFRYGAEYTKQNVLDVLRSGTDPAVLAAKLEELDMGELSADSAPRIRARAFEHDAIDLEKLSRALLPGEPR